MNGNSDPMTTTDPNERARELLADALNKNGVPKEVILLPTTKVLMQAATDAIVCAISHAPAAAAGSEARVTDGMVDAYLAAQAKAVQAVDDKWGAGGKAASYLHPVREACRAGLEAALAAQPAVSTDTNQKWIDRAEAKLAAQQADADEDAYVIDRLAHLLAEISVIVNGPEPAGTKWSYHDLPAKVRALAAQPAAGDAVAELRALRQAYVRLLESGRDRIRDLGGACDPVDVMERSDVDLRRVDAFLAAAQQPGAGDVDGTHTATPCHWIEDTDSGAWDTACGQKHLFTAGDATDNGHSFCPYCGGRLFSQLTSVEPQP